MKTEEKSNDKVNGPALNFERVEYYQNAIRNMRLFTDNFQNEQQVVVSEMPYQIDIMKINGDRIYIASAEKMLCVFDLITLGHIFGDKRIITSNSILSITFHGEKIYIG